ncbi:MAG TPA: hypothetical protein VGJ00_02310 [Rhabdochlamydiaceae bacterium]|jgi:hypothetical protein
MHSIATIIHFCSNEYAFLKNCIEEAQRFSSQIIIPICDHFFDGVPEERALLNGIYAEHPDVQFVEFPFLPNSLYAEYTHLLHNLSRIVGFSFVNTHIEYVLFLDSDEIAEGKSFVHWLDYFPYREFEGFSLANYWYFRTLTYQSLVWECTPIFIKKSALAAEKMMDPKERAGIYRAVEGKKQFKALGCQGRPMIHHYSWVRTKEQMLRKAASWGHRAERDWEALIEQEFSQSFSGRDFVHGYSYICVPAAHNIDLTAQPQRVEREAFAHVERLTKRQLHDKINSCIS